MSYELMRAWGSVGNRNWTYKDFTEYEYLRQCISYPEKSRRYLSFRNAVSAGHNLKYGTLHEFACHPCAGAMLISVSFQF